MLQSYHTNILTCTVSCNIENTEHSNDHHWNQQGKVIMCACTTEGRAARPNFDPTKDSHFFRVFPVFAIIACLCNFQDLCSYVQPLLHWAPLSDPFTSGCVCYFSNCLSVSHACCLSAQPASVSKNALLTFLTVKDLWIPETNLALLHRAPLPSLSEPTI